MANENPTPEGPLTPDAVRTEVQQVMTNPQHPHHEGYTKGWTTANRYVDSLYRRIPGGATKVQLDAPIGATPTPEASDAAAADLQSAVSTALTERGIRGIDKNGAKAEGERLFAGKDGQAVLDLLEAPLDGLAPQAEVQAHVVLASYLADLNRLRREPPPTPQDDTGTPEAFQASLDSELAKRGIDRRALAEVGAQLFTGREGARAHRHFEKYLDALPAGARLAAYVRSAEALMVLRRLFQSVG